MKVLKRSLFVAVALGAAVAFAGNGDVESGSIKGIICSGLDNSQKPVQVRALNIRPASPDAIGFTREGSEAVLSVATEKRTTTLCKSASVMGFVSKRLPMVESLDGDLYIECDGSGFRDQSAFKGFYFLRLQKVEGGYTGDFCGGEVKTIGGVDIDHDCVFRLTCTVPK
jgi:hypothetical protein